MDKSSIAIIIPSYEPTEKLPLLVSHLRAQFSNRIILVNDGSNREKFQNFFERSATLPDVILLEHESNSGKGRALKTAFSYCLEHEIPGAVTADSDGQHLPEDISRCMDALAEHPETLVMGVRDFQQKDVPFKSKFGNTLTCSVFRMLTGRALSDTQTGLRGISADFMKKLLDVPGERFEFETKMLWEAKVLDIPYQEVKISTVYEDGNSGTHFRPVRDSWLIYKTLLGGSFLQFIIFAFSGLLSFLVDIGLFSLFFYVIFCKFPQKLLISVVLARCVSAFVNYLLNRNIVFHGDERKFDLRSLTGYLLLCLVIMASSFGLTKGAIALFPACNEAVLKSIVDILLFCISFLSQKFFVFKSSQRK
ncbi:MAG: bifunctional glycosyltransferase family 2/GtrA family protein [Lentisphaeria bacterium]|nr:bifunctional glycosyltransferase family 2/GtrA family protein [Lentisphaeria bacterium]